MFFTTSTFFSAFFEYRVGWVQQTSLELYDRTNLRIEIEAAQRHQCLAWEEGGWCEVYPECAPVSFIAHHYLSPELFCHHFITIIFP